MDDAARTTEVSKEKARELEADSVGIARVTPNWVYEGKMISYRYAMCRGISVTVD